MYELSAKLPNKSTENLYEKVNRRCYILNLLLSVINVSVQTVDIVNSLPKLKFD